MPATSSNLAKRSFQSSASCTVGTWSANSLGQTPCLVAAYIYGPCSNNDFTTPAAPLGTHYTPGNNTFPPTACSCSWVAYNLLQACAACQCQDCDEDIATWGFWQGQCSLTPGTLTNGTWFPAGYQIPSGTAIPAWAVQDPNTWTNAQFSLSQAEAISQSNTSEFTTAPTPSASSPPTSSPTPSSGSHTPVGAIAGGVVGGVVFLAAFIGFMFWYLSRFHKEIKATNIQLERLNNSGRTNSGFSSHFPKVTPFTSPSPHTSPPPAPVFQQDYFAADPAGGQLAMRVISPTTGATISQTQAQRSHDRTFSGDTSFGSGQNRPFSIDSSVETHNRTRSNDSSLQNVLGQMIITPWRPPSPSTDLDGTSDAHGMSSNQPTSTAATVPPISEKARLRQESSSSTPRRFNPPTYEQTVSGRTHHPSLSSSSTQDLTTYPSRTDGTRRNSIESSVPPLGGPPGLGSTSYANSVSGGAGSVTGSASAVGSGPTNPPNFRVANSHGIDADDLTEHGYPRDRKA